MKISIYTLLKFATSFLFIVLATACGGSQQESSLEDSSSLLEGDGVQELPLDQSPSPTPTEVPELAEIFEIPSDWNVGQIAESNCSPSDLSNNLSEHFTESMSKLFVWLTGTVEQARYEPIGEVANYFGFAALRSEYRTREGDGADEGLRGSLYMEVLELLDNDQRAILYDAFHEHIFDFEEFLRKRLELVEIIWALKNGVALNYDIVTPLLEDIGRYEARITATTAKGYAELIATLSGDQINYLYDIRNGIVTIEQMQTTSLPYAAEARAQYNELSDNEKELMTEFATKIVPWITGDLADAVFLPSGKIGNYFGFAYYRYVDRANVSRATAASYVRENLTERQLQIACGIATMIDAYTNDYILGRESLITDLYAMRDGDTYNTEPFVENYAQQAGNGEGRRVVIEALGYLYILQLMNESQLQTLQTLR